MQLYLLTLIKKHEKITIFFIDGYCLSFNHEGAECGHIGTTSPTAQFHTTGTVRHAVLTGIGIRPVFVDANGNLLGNIPALPASAATNSTAQTIPDFSCTGISSVNTLSGLPAAVQSASIEVTINLTHARLADLSIYLTAPGGSIINLLSPSTGEAGANFTGTIFTDGGLPLTSGTAPYTGVFRPSADMNPSICGITPTAAYFGAIGGGTINPNGNWTLRVIDNTTGNSGTLKSWTIAVVSGLGIDGLWGLKGNSGTNAFNFIGTTDGTPLHFKVNNFSSGLIDTSGNTFFGFKSGINTPLLTNYGGNTGIGANALQSNTGQSNTAIGSHALASNESASVNTAVGNGALQENQSGNGNTAIGNESLLLNYSGKENTAVGDVVLLLNQTGNWNTAVGGSAMFSNSSGYSNTALGASALYSNADGSNLVAVGDSALFSNGSVTHNSSEAIYNTAIGSKALSLNTKGAANSALGFNALRANSSGSGNTAVGFRSLYQNTTGGYNSSYGVSSLFSNSTGNQNTGSGAFSLFNNTTGYSNTAMGTWALYSNTTAGSLVAIGDSALYNNGIGAVNSIDGFRNVAVGAEALFNNTTGAFNTAIGGYSLFTNNTGGDNTALGDGALLSNTSGNNNVAVGINALSSNLTGIANIAIGRNADVSGTLNNAIAIGYYATVDASNKVRLGNTQVTVIEGQVPFTSPSDGRFKTNITETVKGLDFITRLRPVIYNFQTKNYDAFLRKDMPISTGNAAPEDFSEAERIRQSGFIAQEVEKAAKDAGYDFNGVVVPKNEKQTYGLSYSQFVVPLVKAVQEQQQQIEALKKENEALVSRLTKLEAQAVNKK